MNSVLGSMKGVSVSSLPPRWRGVAAAAPPTTSTAASRVTAMLTTTCIYWFHLVTEHLSSHFDEQADLKTFI